MSAGPRPVITLLSDYGVVDEFVGVLHGVIAGICPEAHVIDLAHGVAPADVRAGAALLLHTLPYTPVGVHVAIVDPTVGGRRRAVALRLADGRRLVGPDNGLLWPAAQAAGGVSEAVEISASPWRLEPVSATFHGRDIFAPVAARLAAGAPLAQAGAALDPAELVALELPEARIEQDVLLAPVLSVDHFGNIQLGARRQDLERMGVAAGQRLAITGASGERHPARYVRTFADGALGELLVLEDASGRLAVVRNQAEAAALLGGRGTAELRLAAWEPTP